jgi:hypothetical protein
LATADVSGHVDTAIYSTPHFCEDGTLAFIMREHLTHKNLQSNPYANYAFIEDVPGHKGIRLFLKKTGEDTNEDLITKMTRRYLTPEEDKARGPKYIVYFEVEKILNLIGSTEPDIKLA